MQDSTDAFAATQARSLMGMGQALINMRCDGDEAHLSIACRLACTSRLGVHLLVLLAGVASQPARHACARLDMPASFAVIHDGREVDPDDGPPEAAAFGRVLTTMTNGDADTAYAVAENFYDLHPQDMPRILMSMVDAAHLAAHGEPDSLPT